VRYTLQRPAKPASVHRARRERRAGEPLTITVDAATCGESLDYFLVRDASGNVVAKWGNVPGESKPAPYTPDGSAPPKPWARDVGELADRVDLMHSHLAAVARKLEAFASKPASVYRAWRDDPAGFDYLHDGERIWSRYEGEWGTSMVDVRAMVICNLRELKGPELDEIAREFVNRDRSE
jgi:hypothetical protein